MITSRRSFLTGAVATLFAAPAIVRCTSLMPVKAIDWWAGPPWLGDVKFFFQNGDIVPHIWTGASWLTHPEWEHAVVPYEPVHSSNTLIVTGGGRAEPFGVVKRI